MKERLDRTQMAWLVSAMSEFRDQVLKCMGLAEEGAEVYRAEALRWDAYRADHLLAVLRDARHITVTLPDPLPPGRE